MVNPLYFLLINIAICSENTNHCSLTHQANTISVHQKYQYFNKTINCDNNMDCTIICKSTYSCSYASIYCPSGYNCNVYCFNQYACDHALIEAENSTSLTIKTSGNYALQYGTINAPMHQNELNLLCNAYSCRYIKINAPYSYINSLQCTGLYSCQTMRMSSEYASYVDWKCTGSYACRDSMVWHHNTNATYFGLHCEGSYACDDLYAIVSAQIVNINCEDAANTCGDTFIFSKSEKMANITCKSQAACNSMDVYCIEPSKTLNVLRGDAEFIPTIVLHCGLLYENACTLKANSESNELLCDETEICSNYLLDYANTNYIVYQWGFYNYKQNITCDASKINCEIYCSGSNACRYNTIKCPSNPQSVCKIYAGSSGCRDSKIFAESIASLQIISAGSYAFASSEFHVESNITNAVCSYSYGCSSMNLNVQNRNSVLTLYCPSSYSCQSLKLHAGFDLFNYTFNGIGDYYYLHSENFKILVRMEKFNNGSIMTKLGLDLSTSYSILLASDSFNRSTSATINTLEVAINKEEQILNIYMNKEIMLFTSDLYGIKIVIGDISVNYLPNNIIIRCTFGVFIEIWLRNIDNELQFIEFTVDVNAKYQNTVNGLIGNYDEDETNDLESRNGKILSDASTLEEIHYNFGLSWLLNDTDNNIFHNAFVSSINPFDYKPLFGFDNIASPHMINPHEMNMFVWSFAYGQPDEKYKCVAQKPNLYWATKDCLTFKKLQSQIFNNPSSIEEGQ